MASRAYMPSETVDFVVVGSGAAGGIMARELSQAGFSVAVLEQGPRLGPGEFEHDEFKYNYLSGITNRPQPSPQTLRDDPAAAERPRMGSSPIYAGRGQPTMTIEALAFRAAEHIGQFAKNNEI